MPGAGGKLYAEMLLDVNRALQSLNQFKKSIAESASSSSGSMRKLKHEIDNTGQSVDRLSKGFSGIAQVIAGLGLARAFKGMIDSAMEFELTTVILKRSFGEMADDTERWARIVSKSFGVPLQELRKAATSFNIILKSQLKNEEAAAGLSKQLAEVGKNLARAFGTDIEQALHAIQSGLIGINLPLHRFDIMIYEHTLAEYALQKGIKGTYKELDNATKTWLRAQYIIENATFASGLAAQQTNTLYGQLAILKANVKALAVEIGSSLSPALTGWTTGVNNLIESYGRLKPAVKSVLAGMIGWGTAAVAAFLVIPPLITGLMKLMAAWKMLYVELVKIGAIMIANQARVVASIATMGKLALAALAAAAAYGMLRNAIDAFQGKAIPEGHALVAGFKRAFQDISDAFESLFVPQKIDVHLSDTLKKEIEAVMKPTNVFRLEGSFPRVNPLDILGKQGLDKGTSFVPEVSEAELKKLKELRLDADQLLKISQELKKGNAFAIESVKGWDTFDNAVATVETLTAKVRQLKAALDTAGGSREELEEAMRDLASAQKHAADKMKAAQKEAADKMKAQEKAFAGTITGMWGPLGDFFTKMGKGISDLAKEALGALKSLAGGNIPVFQIAGEAIGTAMGGPAGAAAGKEVGQLLDALSRLAPGFDHMSKMIQTFVGGIASTLTPFIEIFAAWFAILTPLTEALGGIIMAFQPLMDLVGGSVFYVFKGLALVVNTVAIALLTFSKWITFGMSTSVNKALSDAEKRQKKIWDMTYDGAKRATDGLNALAAATYNVPSGYKIAAARFKADEGIPAEPFLKRILGSWGMGGGWGSVFDYALSSKQREKDMGLQGVTQLVERYLFSKVETPEEFAAHLFTDRKAGGLFIEKILLEVKSDNPDEFARKLIEAIRNMEARGHPHPTT